jgi:hypothetical protein
VLAGFGDIARIADVQRQMDVMDNLVSNLCKFTMLQPANSTRPQVRGMANVP